jgi:hypothetical protein
VSIRYLVCHGQVIEAIWSAKSLVADTRIQKWNLVFHDDGSLSVKDVGLLIYHFPHARVIRRAEADLEMANRLPAAVLSLKLFDFAHFSHGRPYLALDTDVLFFEDPVELYDALSGSDDCIRWNEDHPETASFSHTVDEIYVKTGLQPLRFNSGVLAVPQPFTHWEQIESWLHVLGKPRMEWALEQTMYALIAALGGGAPLPNRYDVLEAKWPNVISEHYYWRSRRNMYRVGYPALCNSRLAYCQRTM